MLKEIYDRLKESILLRREQDAPLIDWYIFILLNSVTMGIYGFVMMFKRYTQADNYVARKILYFQNVGEFITELSREKGSENTNRERLNSLIMQYKTKCQPIKPFEKPVELKVMEKKIFQNVPLTMVIVILTLGIFMILWDYFIHNLPPKVFQNLHAA